MGSGSFDFKRHWGFEPQPLAYQFVLRGNNAIPDISPSNPKLQLSSPLEEAPDRDIAPSRAAADALAPAGLSEHRHSHARLHSLSTCRLGGLMARDASMVDALAAYTPGVRVLLREGPVVLGGDVAAMPSRRSATSRSSATST